MKENKIIKGFSKLSKDAKIEWLITNYFENTDRSLELLKSYWHSDEDLQKLHDEFIENTLSNFYMPYGVAPNFMINGRTYCLPMAIEESSVVAAMAKAANFWADKGGFHAKVLSTTKIGHVHFLWSGQDKAALSHFFDQTKDQLLSGTSKITQNMRARGGGILDIQLVDKTDEIPNYYQIEARFETCDSMGANFINSVLEEFAQIFKAEMAESSLMPHEIEVVMCILSNYTPECLVRAEVSCPIERMVEGTDIAPEVFAKRFATAVKIAETQPYRAVTHNKGIMNGIDAMVMATGNDFRAIEACAHAYAARKGQYTSLTHVSIENGIFRFWIEIPLALGTVGGITSLHPMVKFSHEMLGKPSATELMCIIASAGLAQNFSALRSLTTTGIQKGHMKMHLLNILNQLEATEAEKEEIVAYFKDKVPSYRNTIEIFCKIRGIEESVVAERLKA